MCLLSLTTTFRSKRSLSSLLLAVPLPLTFLDRSLNIFFLSFCSCPPAQTSDRLREKSRLPTSRRMTLSQVLKSTRGTSTLFWMKLKLPVGESLPQPATQHLTPVPFLYW